jgi:hypothetical protein
MSERLTLLIDHVKVLTEEWGESDSIPPTIHMLKDDDLIIVGISCGSGVDLPYAVKSALNQMQPDIYVLCGEISGAIIHQEDEGLYTSGEVDLMEHEDLVHYITVSGCERGGEVEMFIAKLTEGGGDIRAIGDWEPADGELSGPMIIKEW